MKTTRREFLSMGGSLLLAPSAPVWAEEPRQIAEHAMVNPELPWREPGQVKDPAYLKTAQLRYGAKDGAIVGHNRTCFNNRPLYCEPQTDCGIGRRSAISAAAR